MRPGDITIEVVDGDLKRVGQIARRFWTDVALVMRLRRLGTWGMTLPAELPMAKELAKEGSGILVTGPGWTMSGPVDEWVRKQTPGDPRGVLSFSGFDHMVLLAGEQAYPDPAEDDVAAQTEAYDIRSGPAESVIRAYVNANIGPGAPASRRTGLFTDQLVLQPDLARGSTVRGQARFDELGPFLLPLGQTGNVGYRIVQVGTELQLEFFVPQDKTKSVRLDVANGRLASLERGVKAPTVTRVVVAGQGQGVDRMFIERTSSESLAAEAAWRRRVARFRDQRQTDDLAQLQQAGDEDLADGGRTTITTKLVPSDDLTMRFGVDWNLGDLVTAVVDDVETEQIASTVALSIRKDGVRTVARVGE